MNATGVIVEKEGDIKREESGREKEGEREGRERERE